jgi:error-prone DNA polymerase
VGAEAPRLPGMSPVELGAADLWATGLSGDSHPVQFARERLDALGAVAAEGLAGIPPGTRVLVGGVVTHRQRPATAGGTTFLNLEDETGLVNVICSRGVWARYRRVGRTAAALLGRGRHQPGRRPAPASAPGRRHPLPRLPLTPGAGRCPAFARGLERIRRGLTERRSRWTATLVSTTAATTPWRTTAA